MIVELQAVCEDDEDIALTVTHTICGEIIIKHFDDGEKIGLSYMEARQLLKMLEIMVPQLEGE